jgi:serine/threonine-protein kinase
VAATGHLLYAVGTSLFAVPFDVAERRATGAAASVIDGRLARAGNPANTTAAANYEVADNGTLVFVDRGTGGFNFLGGPGGAVAISLPLWVDRRGREQPLGVPPRAYAYARISPDGTRIAFDIRDQELDLWMWDVSRRVLSRFTFDPTQDVLPAWTPDSRRIAWTPGLAGALVLHWQAADGSGTPEVLTTRRDAQRASGFTPDGRHLLFSVGDVAASEQDLAMLTLDGDRRITMLLDTPFSELGGEVSPDGRWLAYQSNESGQFQIYVRPFPDVNQGRWQVSSGGGEEPLWARNGRELFYLAPDGTLMGVPVDLTASQASFVAGAPEQVLAPAGYYTRVGNQLGRTYDVSADGSRFLRIKPLPQDARTDAMPPDTFVVVQHWTEELRRLAPSAER